MLKKGAKIVKIEEGGKIKIPYVLQRPGKYLVFEGEDYVTIKKITKVSPRQKFDELVKEIQKRAKELKLSQKIAREAIQWARRS